MNLPTNLCRMTGGPGTSSPGQFTCLNCTLKPLVQRAYNLRTYELVGPDSMIDSDKWDIVAKISKDVTKEEFLLMLRNLLVERFGLVVHRETQNRQLYELVVAKGGPKLREYKVPASAPSKDGQRYARGKDGLPELTPGAIGVLVLPAGPNTRLSAGGVSLAELLRMLEIQIGRPVTDKTGLTGKYDFDVTWAMKRWTGPSYPAEPTADTFDATEFGPTLLTAFQSQLGLKFEPKDGPVEVLVVDHVSKAPTEN